MCLWKCLCQKFITGQDNYHEAKNAEKHVSLKYSQKQILGGENSCI